ncbi:hypothetical protein AAG906_034360 [Vitis piasezkii]
MMDLDMALREDEPPKPTNESTKAMRTHYAKWERSNHLSLISIKRSIAEHLLGGIPESNNAKEFLVVSWGVNDLITKCVAEEEKLKREKNESAHLGALGKLNNQKIVENARKPNFHNHKKSKNFKKSGSEKQKNGNAKNTYLKCYHCNKKDSWWLDSGATVHVATSLQGIRNLRKPSEKENLISLPVLDKTGYSFTFANKRVEVIYDSKVIGNCVLSDGLYRLSLLSACSYNVENSVTKRPLTKEISSLLWHKRLRHISKERVERLISSGILPRLNSDDFEICVDCVKGKLIKTKKKGASRSQNLLEIVHTDISGPYSTTLCGNKYFITFIDDFSRYGYMYLIKEKVDDLEMFKVFRIEVEKQLGKVIKIVRSDRGGEYYGKHGDVGQQNGLFARYLQDNGIVARYTMPGSPEQNGMAERWNRTLMEMKRSMMSRSNLPEYLWGEAIKTVTYILNRVPRVANVNFPTIEINPIVDEIPLVEMRKSQRTRRPAISNDYYVHLGEREYNIGEEVDLTTYCETLSSDKANEWLIAMRDEM